MRARTGKEENVRAEEGKQPLAALGAFIGGRLGMAAAVMTAVVLAACLMFVGSAPQQRSTTSDDQGLADTAWQAEPELAAAFAWTPDSDCGMCHEKEIASQQDAACTASKHPDVACATCHADQAGLEAAHEAAQPDGKGATALVKTAVDDAVCASCHNAADLAAKTTESAVLTDSEGTVVNPHDLPENEDHAATECTSCHKMHSSTGVEKTATRYCKSCHHTDVYQCYTCHS